MLFPRVILFLLLSALSLRACLWDRDTLAEEAKGRLDTVKAIIGWFDRYPPKYYEMRLERVAKELAVDPKRLDLYDDAGVACSRLGRNDEAIAWMAKKKAVLDTLPEQETAEDRYRYLSNLGTFHLIRWIVKPQEQRDDDLSDLKASEDFIARALELNPDAHFGREKYQLMLIRWLLEESPVGIGIPGSANFLDGNIDLISNPGGRYSKGDPGLEDARKGITGLIQLGAAWQSIDTFRTLQVCLHCQRSASLAHLAYLRQKELVSAGMSSLHSSPEVREEMAPHGEPQSFLGAEKVEAFYKTARAASDARLAAWTAYQEARFGKGMHPDTHSDFWKDWREPAVPALPDVTFEHWRWRHPGLVMAFCVLSLVAAIAMLTTLGKRIARTLAKRRRVAA